MVISEVYCLVSSWTPAIPVPGCDLVQRQQVALQKHQVLRHATWLGHSSRLLTFLSFKFLSFEKWKLMPASLLDPPTSWRYRGGWVAWEQVGRGCHTPPHPLQLLPPAPQVLSPEPRPAPHSFCLLGFSLAGPVHHSFLLKPLFSLAAGTPPSDSPSTAGARPTFSAGNHIHSGTKCYLSAAPDEP